MATSKIGLSMLYCLSEPFKRMTKHLTNIETNYVEIVDDGLHTLNRQRIKTLKDIAGSHSLKYSVHAPFADINIASPSKPLLRAVCKRLKESIAYARALDAYMWILHPGLKTGISMFYPDMDWHQNIETVRLLFKVANDYGVRIAIENVPEPYPFLMKSVEQFTRFYEEINEDIGLVLDVGHANINCQIERFIETFANKIVHVHAHDNDGKTDQHLGIGYGTVNWENFAKKLRMISYDKVVVIESIMYVNKSVQKMKKLLA
ncbi:MAG: sugar phosphate isomerase/epimerase family protein [Candidatus Bathyarchaeota archaeon]|jgi:sugar phosphate isomerase/epimerase|nr:sugar phosphate isomerase/epimerase [Candidatus Bathyarchaeota archaeon A05DMB-5]MDH7558507.1 sugar phosphate isomerase/epimerase family protein [Candidatus Bathyarchaeota archaeon]